jgi:hypothetical protein
MLRKAIFLTVALMMAFTVNASAQCTFGVYADAEGTQSSTVAVRDLGSSVFTLDVYYVMYVEDFVSGAAWNREVTGAFQLLGATQNYDPLQQFLEVTPDGFRMGLGGCEVGFGGGAVFVLWETLVLQDDYSGGTGFVQVTPNPLQDDTQVVYTQCDQEATKQLCDGMGSLFIESIVPTAGRSFGAVKALYK